MKPYILLLFCALWVCNVTSQNKFEKGYFIDNTGMRKECLIHNMDWQNNPENFQFKVSEDAEVQSKGIREVQEFGIEGKTKYQRHTVMLDTSSDLTSELSFQRVPTFTEETLFLKVLVEGRASLFQYERGNSRRFFYNMDDNAEVRPLIYKRYKGSNKGTGTNNQFRDQLAKQVDCPDISKASISRLEYKPDPLVRLFGEINLCKGDEAEIYALESSRFKIHLAARAGISYAHAYVEQKPVDGFPGSRKVIVDYGGTVYPRFGVELELVLPYKGGKWSLFLDPSYQVLRSEKQFIQRIALFDVETKSELIYKTIEVPFGVRHHFFLTDQSRLFVNASVALVFNSNSEVNFETPTALGAINTIEIERSEAYFSLGLGYRYNQRWSLEARYNTNRDFLGDVANWTSTFDQNVSLILGIRLL